MTSSDVTLGHSGNEDRRRRIEQVVDDLMMRRAAGEDVSNAAVITAHRELMPELGERLRSLALIQHAGDRADVSGPMMPPSGSISESTRFPGYESVELLGRGGQGVVYRAEQAQTRRPVAIKVLMAQSHASASGRKRFSREMQLVGQLKHPNIISIYHSSETADGQPFYVMDYVEGQRLDAYVKDTKPAIESILELIATVCDAVQYAHQRGVIHRDIKPSNILVDEDGHVKLLDFGLAKWAEDSRDDGASETDEGVGTLRYMSPEQLNGWFSDTRSDVYALGVVLYQLLTGSFPYEVRDTLLATAREIDEREPMSPIYAWDRNSGVSSSSAIRLRSGQCPIHDEVDTIVLKAISKQPDRRYQSPGEFAQDLRRHLSGDPIQAKPDSALYVLRKTLCKHWLSTSVATSVVLLVSVAAVVYASLYQRANDQKIRADDYGRDALRVARLVVENIDEDLNGVIGAGEIRLELLREATREYAKVLLAAEGDAALEAELAAGYVRLTSIAGQLGEPEQEAYAQEAMRLTDTLIAKAPEEPAHLRLRIRAYQNSSALMAATGEFESAEELLLDGLALSEQLHAIGACTLRDHLREALLCDHLAKAAKRRGDLTLHHQRLAQMYAAAQKVVDADDSISDGQYVLALSHERLGDVARNRGNRSEAKAHYEASLRFRQEITRSDPSMGHYQDDLSWSHQRLGLLAHYSGRHEAAASHLKEFLEINERLVSFEPDHIRYLTNLGWALMRNGDLAKDTDRLDDAEEHYSRREVLYRTRILLVEPSNPEHRSVLGWCHERLGIVDQRRGRLEAANARFAKLYATMRDLAHDYPENPQYRLDLALSCQRLLGTLPSDRGKERHALITEHRAIIEGLASEYPDNVDYQEQLAKSFQQQGYFYKSRGEYGKARASYTHSLKVHLELASADPDHVRHRSNAAWGYRALGKLAFESRELDAAAEHYNRMKSTALSLIDGRSESTEFKKLVLLAASGLASVALDSGNVDKASAHLDDHLETAVDLLGAEPTNAFYLNSHAFNYQYRADLEKARGNRLAEEKAILRSIEIRKKMKVGQRDVYGTRNAICSLLDRLGALHLAGKDNVAARADYESLRTETESILESKPEDLTARRFSCSASDGLARVSYAEGNVSRTRELTAEALDCFEQLVARDEVDAVAYHQYANTLLHCEPASMRDPVLARDMATRATEVSTRPNPQYLDTLARAHHACDQHYEAAAAQQEALDLLPEGNPDRAAYSARLAVYATALESVGQTNPRD